MDDESEKQDSNIVEDDQPQNTENRQEKFKAITVTQILTLMINSDDNVRNRGNLVEFFLAKQQRYELYCFSNKVPTIVEIIKEIKNEIQTDLFDEISIKRNSVKTHI